MKLADRVEALRRVPTFGKLSRRSFERIARSATVVEAPAGTVLIQARAPAAGMFIVAEGKVSVDARRDHWELGAGQVVGELALLTPESLRTARVRAKTPVRLLAISRDDFRELLLGDPKLAVAMLELVAARLAGMLE